MTQKLELRVRDLNTGDTSSQAFAGEAEAIAWLTARPRFVDVLGVSTVGIPHDLDLRLRAALRPLDADEKALDDKLKAAHEGAARARHEEEARRAAAAADAHRSAQKNADPNRQMEVHWSYDHGFDISDPTDTRPISEEVKEAVLAWIRERDEWVANRGQIVGDAKVVVWPADLPKGEERVKRGTFIPVTAPAKS